jgi:chromosome segregation ATPase
MPPRKAPAKKMSVVAQSLPLNEVDDKSVYSESDVLNQHSNMIHNIAVSYNSNDSDRVQLAQAINNLTVKGEQFVNALNSFSTFKETIMQLDIQIETKKKQYKEIMEKLDRDYKESTLHLQREYAELSKQSHATHTDNLRVMQNELKNNQLEVTQKLKEYELKGCEDLVKKYNMMVLKVDEYKNLTETINRVNRELEDLKKKFVDNCNAIKTDEKNRYETELKRQRETQELIHKTNCAEIKAQLEQQKREIDMLNETIETLKLEIAEQRNLTKEIANASSKAQINQRFGKE